MVSQEGLVINTCLLFRSDLEHLLNFEIHAHKMTNNTVISNILHILRKRGYKKSLRGGFSV